MKVRSSLVDLGDALPVHHADFHGGQAEGLAVGLSVDHCAVADHAGAAGAVNHVDLDIQALGEFGGDDVHTVSTPPAAQATTTSIGPLG